jgi:HEAT repeat protein
MIRSLTAAVVLAVLGLTGTARADEPTFNGRKLSEWMTVLKEDETPRKRRAAVVALGQIAAEHRDSLGTVVAAVGRALRTDASPAVREQAAVVLGQMRPEETAAALTDLTESMRVEKESAVKREVAVALARLGAVAKPAVQPLTAALEDADPTVRAAAADALGRIGPDARSAAPTLLALLKDAQKPVRRAAVFALGRVDPEEKDAPAAALVGVLKSDSDIDLRREALLALGFLGERSESVVTALASILADKNAELRALAALTLGRFGSAVRSVDAVVLKALKTDPEKDVRLNLVRTLCSGYGSDAPSLIPILAERLKDDPAFEVRVAIAEELGGFGPAGKPAIPALRIAQRDPQIKVREAATAAIKSIERLTPKPKP